MTSMKVRLDRAAGELDIEWASDEALQAFLAGARRHASFLVELDERLAQFSALRVRLRSPAGELELGVRVLQVFPSSSGGSLTAFEVAAADLDRLVLPSAPLAAATAEPVELAEADEEEGGERSDSLFFRIRALNVSERMRLATRAGRAERQVLLRDNSPQVLLGLLANPLIEDQEILELVKSPHAVGGVLERVGRDPRWTGSYEIRLLLVKNPRTPTVLAQRLLATLTKKDLGVLAKSPHLRETVKGAALRLYLGTM